MATVNMTFEIDDHELSNFENAIRNRFKVISFRHLPDTSLMYKNNTHFKKMVDSIKKLQKDRDIYINDNLYKYRNEDL